MAENTFGGYTNVTEVISANAQTAVLVQIDKLRALIRGAGDTTPAPSPDFSIMPPALGTKLKAEIDALKVAIDAAPTS